jgi:hypothetical protein
LQRSATLPVLVDSRAAPNVGNRDEREVLTGFASTGRTLCENQARRGR